MHAGAAVVVDASSTEQLVHDSGHVTLLRVPRIAAKMRFAIAAHHEIAMRNAKAPDARGRWDALNHHGTLGFPQIGRASCRERV